MHVITWQLKRHLSYVIVAVMVVAVMSPLFIVRTVSAYGVLQNRYIKISNSAASATNVSYEVGFDIATTNTVQGIVVDFCSNSPIIGDTCTEPTVDFSVDSATLTEDAGITGFSIDATATVDRTLVLTNGTGGSLSSGTVVQFTLSGVNNPSTTGTFYARILTYTTTTGATGYTDTSPGSEPPLVDAGGVALSTASQITITAKVQERLTFCVYTSGAGYANNDCDNKSGSSVALGDDNGVLSPSGPFVDKNARYSVTTNASSNVIIRLKGNTLESGAYSISAIGATAAASSAGTEQFGFCTHQVAGSGLTPAAPYNHASCSTTTQTAGTASTGGAGTAEFAFDTTNTTSTYGQSIGTKTAGEYSTGELAFIGNIANTTEAGIYTTTLKLIATGTY